MAQNPKYDNDMVNLGYLNKRLGQTEESINKNNSSISQIPKNYSTPPNPPYYKDSLLCYGNKIYRCNNTKLKGEFSWNDWAIVATDDTTISDFINNTYEVEKLEIQEQIDGKIQTYYQANDPSKEWVTDLDKGRHVGDYWYNTTNDTQWRYNRITTGSTITYGWGHVNIPKAVFDTIDSKKSIYTEKPTSYQKDDLWIIEETLSDEELPIGTEENPIAKGDWVFSIANSDTYNKEHWVKRDEDISMTYIKQHYYTIGEIESSFEEIERNTDSKITKAKDEISLNVSQTYTTKEEHEATIYDFDEQIGTINQTITNHKETISDLSLEVGEITSTVESIETTTKNLKIDIDGVSADFEEFKDNEYIQSIDNLQKQIDGAIQFWNGAEIPTINNYPANEWTTEKDKINHQADIYTVVQDVEGEMKQGKSYRFDKIDGVWQWIELTDNELSAVQAIAQEALNEANANANEIGTVKTRVSTLEQTDEQIKASVESIDKQIIPTNNATGSNIYIEDASNNPLTYLEIEGKSTQEVRSGKNLSIIDRISNNVVISNELEAGTYTFSLLANGNVGFNLKLNSTSGNAVGWTQGKGRLTLTFTLTESAKIFLNGWATVSGQSFENLATEIQIEKGSAFTGYEQYGISPSPNYPSEIESVGYENLFDINSITENYLYEDGGIFTPATTYNTSDYISCKSNEFIVSAKFTAYNPYIRYIIAEFDENKTYIQRQLNTDSSSPKYTFTLNDNTKYIRLCYRNDATLYDIQLEKGSVAHSYIPYGKYGIEVKTVGKNKFDEEMAKIISNYTANTSIGSSWKTITIDLLPNTEYTITRYANNVSVNGTFNLQFYLYEDITNPLFYVNNASLESKLNKKIVTFTTGESGKIYLASLYGNDERLTNLFNNIDIQIEEGNVSTEFEKYKFNKSVIELNAPLRSLSNGVKDIAYIRNNKLYVNRYVGSVVLDGSESWEYISVSQGSLFRNKTIINNARDVISVPLSNHYLGISPNNASNVRQNNNIYILQTVEPQWIDIIDNRYTSNTDFKTWLSTHNTQVDYELATPVTEEYGEIEMLKTLKGYNNISTTDELLPIINLTYVRDTVIADYVENHVAQLKITENEIKASVESVSSSVDGLNTTINRVEEITTDNSQVINIISTNIDKTSGEVREVTTTTGFTFNADGMTIDDGSGFKAEHTADGTYYKDGEAVVGQYTKDGSKQKDLELFGTYSYGKESINDTPMFVGQLFTNENGEEGFGHFVNI